MRCAVRNMYVAFTVEVKRTAIYVTDFLLQKEEEETEKNEGNFVQRVVCCLYDCTGYTMFFFSVIVSILFLFYFLVILSVMFTHARTRCDLYTEGPDVSAFNQIFSNQF